MPAHFEDNHWPLVVVRLVGADGNTDVEVMLTALQRRMFQGRCAVLFDTSATEHQSLAQAQEVVRIEGKWLRANQALIQRNVVGVAFVITNPAVRFVLSSVLLLAPLPTQHVVTGDENEGRSYCHQLLRSTSSRP